MAEVEGWLLDVYAKDSALTLWIIGQDGQRLPLRLTFPVTFYAAGAHRRLRQLWRFVCEQPIPTTLSRVEKRDLFAGLKEVLAIEVNSAGQQPKLCRQVLNRFPDLEYYNTDIPLAVRFAAVYNLFPLARCRGQIDEQNNLRSLAALDSPWELDSEPAPLKVLSLEPDNDPQHAPPRRLIIRHGKDTVQVAVEPLRRLLLSIAANIKRHNPDLILTRWGDTWLFPLLQRACLEENLNFFNPNRDQQMEVMQRAENSYFTYGQMVHRGRQAHLFGRWHIDRCNAMMYSEYGLAGVLEQARVTSLPVQEMARKSPGAGVTAMQMLTALRQGVLVPHTKQQAEAFKTATELIRADRGGLVYQPIIGLHHHVAEIDFISMYPGLMVYYNVSPETTGVDGQNSRLIPELGLAVDQTREGLVPATLRPLLAKRLAIKERLAVMDRRDCRYRTLKARAAGLKWLLVVCFGYLGYENARFGRIEAHEAVTAFSRDVLLTAKETAEDGGYRILHMYVDALWVKRTDAAVTADTARALAAQIAERTGLPIALEGVYRWIIFLPSRLDERVPVPNRYFGVFGDGTLKTRGIEMNRHDTPPFIAAAQRSALEYLASLPADQSLHAALTGVIEIWRAAVFDLRRGLVPMEDLLVHQRVSREAHEFRSPSPAARALAQLSRAGQQRRPGQRLALIYTRGEPGVYAWDLPQALDLAAVDVHRYEELLVRAADTILRPLGWPEKKTRSQILSNAYQRELPLDFWSDAK